MNAKQSITEALEELVSPCFLKIWLQTPNPALNNQIPSELIARGETTKLWRLVRYLQSGEPSN